MPSDQPGQVTVAGASAPTLPQDLTGRAALVTGGTRGIGLVISSRLLAVGADVLVCGRSEPGSLPANLAFEAADVRDPEQAAAVVAGATSRFGRLDIGSSWPRPRTRPCRSRTAAV